VPTTYKYVKKGVFAEQGNVVVCGSDQGTIYLFDINSEEILQTMYHDNTEVLIQTVEAFSAPERNLIASGSSNNGFDICIWEKPVSERRNLRNTTC